MDSVSSTPINTTKLQFFERICFRVIYGELGIGKANYFKGKLSLFKSRLVCLVDSAATSVKQKLLVEAASISGFEHLDASTRHFVQTISHSMRNVWSPNFSAHFRLCRESSLEDELFWWNLAALCLKLCGWYFDLYSYSFCIQPMQLKHVWSRKMAYSHL